MDDPQEASKRLTAGLERPQAYPDRVTGPVVCHETHISWIFLAGDWAYKIKKPLKTDFLDYSTLERRRHFCEEEVRLDGRFAEGLYAGVVSINDEGGQIRVDGEGPAIEYAVRMRRFDQGALLSRTLAAGRVTGRDVHELAKTVADFHASAAAAPAKIVKAWPEFLAENTAQVIAVVEPVAKRLGQAACLATLRQSIQRFLEQHRDKLACRGSQGAIRECHGDLHAENVLRWRDRWVPFDGIEFSEQLRCIDVLSDAAFLAMDLVARGHAGLAFQFASDYFEQTDDYEGVVLWRFFLIYRALVRALAAAMRVGQSEGPDATDEADLTAHLQLADSWRVPRPATMWITHGFSGSGKSTAAARVVAAHGAYCLRSDVQRKRLFGMLPTERPTASTVKDIYSAAATGATYDRLAERARQVLEAGESVIVDATFLKRPLRRQFRELAKSCGAEFKIVDCAADEAILRRRLAERSKRGDDASDANARVLEQQLANHDPLDAGERAALVGAGAC